MFTIDDASKFDCTEACKNLRSVLYEGIPSSVTSKDESVPIPAPIKVDLVTNFPSLPSLPKKPVSVIVPPLVSKKSVISSSSVDKQSDRDSKSIGISDNLSESEQVSDNDSLIEVDVQSTVSQEIQPVNQPIKELVTDEPASTSVIPRRKPLSSYLVNEMRTLQVGLLKYSLKISSSLGQENYIDYLKHILTYECLNKDRLANASTTGSCTFFFKSETYSIPILESTKPEDYYDAIATQLGQHGIFVPSNQLVAMNEKHIINRTMLKILKKRTNFKFTVSTEYTSPSSADKDLYILHDISGIDKFTEEAKSGELIGYKKIAFYCRID